MKKAVVSVILAVLILFPWLHFQPVLAEEESTVTEVTGWEMILAELDTYDWVSAEEKEEYHKYYTYWSEDGISDERLLDGVKWCVRRYRDMQKEYVFEVPEPIEPIDFSKLTLSEVLDLIKEGLTLVEETVQPRYYMSLRDLAQTGRMMPELREDQDGHLLYVAKVETEDHRFGGNLFFYYDEEGIGRYHSYSDSVATKHPDSQRKTHTDSYWYFDREEEFSAELEKYGEAPVSRENVKLVALAGINVIETRNAFYVHGGHGDYIFLIGYENEPVSRIWPIDDAMREIAVQWEERYQKLHEGYRKWAEEHPGEKPIPLGGAGGPGGYIDDSGTFIPDEWEDFEIPYPEYPSDSGPDEPVPDTSEVPGESDAAETEVPPEDGIRVGLAVAAVCAAAVVILVGALMFFRR
ncbi:MAG: hypothetical protein J6Z23_00355 [Lachnospiraceae bacterium]|nr:hypothetical protein [Lachnospiraceae bacterium]